MKAEKIIAAPFTPPLLFLLRPKSEGGRNNTARISFLPPPPFYFFRPPRRFRPALEKRKIERGCPSSSLLPLRFVVVVALFAASTNVGGGGVGSAFAVIFQSK